MVSSSTQDNEIATALELSLVDAVDLIEYKQSRLDNAIQLSAGTGERAAKEPEPDEIDCHMMVRHPAEDVKETVAATGPVQSRGYALPQGRHVDREGARPRRRQRWSPTPRRSPSSQH